MNTIVRTNSGSVQGSSENGVRVWRGIPYAKNYTGRFRFHEAAPADPWEGVKQTSAFPPALWQLPKKLGGVTEGTPMAEDSLCINIWAPERVDAPLPVMLWIYGGAFASGDGSMDMYDGRFLARRENVVVVNFNYRINAFGFIDFSSIDPECACNCGLRDQLMALRWVFDNIAGFGGDPDNITIFGQSAGANSVTALLSIPAARKYIAKAVAMSSYPVGCNSREQACEVAEEFLDILGVEKKEFAKLYELPAMELVKAAKQLELRMAARGSNVFALAPVADGELLPQRPIASAVHSDGKVIPLVMGTANNEASIYASAPIPLFTCTKDGFAKFFRRYDGNDGSGVIAGYAAHSDAMRYADMGGDAMFRLPSVRFAEEYAKTNPVWFYRFEYYSAILKLKKLYTMHGTDVAFVFDNLGCSIGKTCLMLTLARGGVNALARRFSHCMAQFAATGTVPWEQFCAERHATKVWNVRDSFDCDAFRTEYEAWKKSAYFDSL